MTQNYYNSKTPAEAFTLIFATERLSFNIELLNYKLSWFDRLNAMDKKQQFEYLTVFDSIITHLRAMLLEKKKKNYTLQNYFIKSGKPEIAQNIDDYLDKPFDPQQSRSIRDALKFISDKFVCHFDEIAPIDLGNANYIMSALSNPHSTINLKKIVEDLIAIIEEKEKSIVHNTYEF